jgi:predicted nucleic acid-binding Zn ribbon protein
MKKKPITTKRIIQCKDTGPYEYRCTGCGYKPITVFVPLKESPLTMVLSERCGRCGGIVVLQEKNTFDGGS